MKQKKAGKVAAVIAVGIAIVFLFFYIMCRPSLTQVAGYPTTLPSGSLQNKYYWLPIKVSSLLNIPYSITDIRIESQNNNATLKNIQLYIYDYSSSNIMPGSGYATVEKGFKIYGDTLMYPPDFPITVSSAAIFALLPPNLAIENPMLEISIDYRILGVLKGNASLQLK